MSTAWPRWYSALLAVLVGVAALTVGCTDDQGAEAFSPAEALEELAAAFEELMSKGPVLIRTNLKSPDERPESGSQLTIDRASGRYLLELIGEVDGTPISQTTLQTEGGHTYVFVPEGRRAHSENHAWVRYRPEGAAMPAAAISPADRLMNLGGRIVERETEELDGKPAVRYRLVADPTVSTDGEGGRSESSGFDNLVWVVDGVVAHEEVRIIPAGSTRTEGSSVTTYTAVASLDLPAPLEDHIEVGGLDDANRIVHGENVPLREPTADLEYEPVP